MNSTEYITIPSCGLLSFLRENNEKIYIFQQHNIIIHGSRPSGEWFRNQSIEVLLRPACSFDMNTIENVKGILIQRVYLNSKQFTSVADLKLKIIEE